MKFPKFLRIASLPSSEYVNERTGGKEQVFDHWESQLAALLAAKFGFAYEYISPADGAYGRRLLNGNWTGMVGLLYHAQADLALCGLSVEEHRAEVIDYSIPYQIDRITFATRTQEHFYSTTSFMKPFTVEVWICLLVCILAASFVHVLLFHSRQSLVSRISQNQPVITSNDLLNFSWTITLMFLKYSYTAVLLSFLICPSFTFVRTIKELATEVMKGQYMCVSAPGAYVLDAMLSSPDSHVRIIGRAMRANKGSNHMEEVLGNTKLPKIPAFIEARVRFFSLGRQYFVSDDAFFTDLQAVGVKKGFCCKDELDSAINHIWSSGIYHKMVRDAIFRERLKHMKDSSETRFREPSLSMDKFHGVFILLIAGYVIATFVFFIELIAARRNSGFRKFLEYISRT